MKRAEKMQAVPHVAGPPRRGIKRHDASICVCAYSKCGKAFTPRTQGKKQKFCCPDHRKRAWFEAHFAPIVTPS